MVTNAQTAPLSADNPLRRYKALLRATTAIAGYRDIQTFRDRFAEELRGLIAFEYVLVNIVDPETKAVQWRMFHAPGKDKDSDIYVPDFAPDQTPTTWVYDNQRPIVIDDWQREDRYPELRQYLTGFNIRSSCVLPLTTAHRRIGVLAMGGADPSAYSEQHVHFLGTVADHLALAIDSALNLESSRAAQAELQRKNEQLELMLELTNRVVSNLELRDLLREVSASLRRLMKCDATGVALPEDGQLRVYALDFPDSKGFLTEESVIPMDSPLGTAFHSGKIELRTESQIQEHCPEVCSGKSEGMKSGCFVPLVSKSRVLGVMALSRFAEIAFSEEETDFLSKIARQLAIAVENALAYKEIAELKEKLAQEKLYLEEEIRGEFDFEGIVGQSSALRNVLQMVETVASSDSTVLILGETGTGKELIARAIHERSRRKERTFVKMNCAAIPTGLLESELFGHERGAFTGAISQKVGRLELADRGTLFLDEVGDIPSEIQPKLLRALQEREFERLGSNHTKRVDIRLIAATNRDLEKMVEDRQFRNDLYYRLNVFPIRIPPLRERPEDIPLLVHYFTQKYARRMEKQIDTIPAAPMAKLAQWHWPGNIRELENFIERAVILTRGTSLQFPVEELKSGNGSSRVAVMKTGSHERDEIVRVLKEVNGQVGGPDGAAARLGLKRTTLISRMKKFGINISARQVS